MRWAAPLACSPAARLFAIGRVDVGAVIEQVLQQRERLGAIVQVLGVRATAMLHGEVHRRALAVVHNINLGTGVNQSQGSGQVTFGDGKRERRLHRVVDGVELGTLGNSKLQHGLGAVEGQPVQRRHVALVPRRERRTGVDEDASGLESFRLAREEQRRAQLTVLGPSIRTCSQQC